MLYQALVKRLTGTKDRLIICKRVSTTRWSSRFEAVKSLKKGFSAYKEVLLQLSERNQEAEGLYNTLTSLETGIFIGFWGEILTTFNITSLKSQQSVIDSNTSIALSKSLVTFIEKSAIISSIMKK